MCVCPTFIIQHCDVYLSCFFSSTHLQDGDVPLGIAAQEGHLHVVRKLLQGGANVNHQNKVMLIYSSYMYILLNMCSKPTYIHVVSHMMELIAGTLHVRSE